MQSKRYIALLQLFVLFQTARGFTRASVDLNDLMTGSLFSPSDYEIIDVQDRVDEDVIRLRKRANAADCGTDCLSYSGWEEAGIMKCDEEDEGDDDMPEKRSLLQRRGRKDPMLVCDQVKVGGQPMSGFYLHSPTWPKPGTLIKRYKRVYDTGDPLKPLVKEWFEVKKREQKWTDDIAGRKSKNRCYAAEHVLEWQLLRDFIEADKSLDDNSRCAHLARWFLEPMPKTTYKVKVAKKNGELQSNDHFDYEDVDHGLSKWENKDQSVPRYMEWISFQWPGTAQGKPPSLWEYELVVLNQDSNLKKENVWGNKNFFVQPTLEADGQTMRHNQDNSDTLEWLYKNKYFDKNRGGLGVWSDNKGACKAVYRFMTAMSIAQYHNDPYVKEVMRAQVRRVGEAWELIERQILASKKDPITQKPYQERGLKKEWLDWMTETHRSRLKKLNESMDEKIKVFKGQSTIITKLRRWDYLGVFRRAGVDEPDCGFEKSDQNMQERVRLMVAVYGNMAKAQEELKLD